MLVSISINIRAKISHIPYVQAQLYEMRLSCVDMYFKLL